MSECRSVVASSKSVGTGPLWTVALPLKELYENEVHLSRYGRVGDVNFDTANNEGYLLWIHLKFRWILTTSRTSRLSQTMTSFEQQATFALLDHKIMFFFLETGSIDKHFSES